MAETELEEGEACFQNEDDDSAIDPDIALSYIVSYSVFTFFFHFHPMTILLLILFCLVVVGIGENLLDINFMVHF